VMLLPHGLEGQGAEHSSCRIERFLELAEDDNIQIMNLTTPAQYFHGLRLQAIRKWRKPLIIATPKSLLRHPEAISSLDDLAKGGFQTVIADEEVKTAKAVLLCTGKVYYDLLHARKDRGRRDVAIVRLEQIYPFPEEVLSGVLARYGKTTPVVWVQEEPGNMAVYPCLRQKYCENLLGHPLSLVSRPNSPSPATGHASSHKLEQQILVDEALSI
jgi:2-oxoglutarate dehydrogenase E1 component